ncbi:MAG TPA: hypothetical protein VII43_05750 [Opitutaceae bacterium]
MSWIAKALLLLAGFLALLALAWMVFLPSVVEHELRELTGFNVKVAVLTANPFTGRVVARGFVATNPSTYPKPGFIEVRVVRVDLSLFSLAFSDRIVVDDLDVDIDTVELVRRHDGHANAIDFASAFTVPAAASPAPALGKRTHYLVRKLHLRLDRLIVEDYTGSKSYEKSYDLHIDQSYSNVIDSRQLLSPEVVKSLHKFGLHHEVSELLPGDFGRALADAVGGAAQLGAKLQDALRETGDAAKGLIDKLDQSKKP